MFWEQNERMRSFVSHRAQFRPHSSKSSFPAPPIIQEPSPFYSFSPKPIISNCWLHHASRMRAARWKQATTHVSGKRAFQFFENKETRGIWKLGESFLPCQDWGNKWSYYWNSGSKERFWNIYRTSLPTLVSSTLYIWADRIWGHPTLKKSLAFEGWFRFLAIGKKVGAFGSVTLGAKYS